MKIAVTKNQNTIAQTISLDDVNRYLSIYPSLGYMPVSYWAGRGLEREGYCGQGVGEYNCAMIPCSGYSFTGSMVKLTVGATFMVSNPTNYLFRWAVTLFRSDNRFVGFQPATGAIGLLGQGTFALEFQGYATAYQEFDIPIMIPANTSFYIYLWRHSPNYGNFHIRSNMTVTAHVSGSALAFYDATPYIYQNGIWKQATAKVFSGGWK